MRRVPANSTETGHWLSWTWACMRVTPVSRDIELSFLPMGVPRPEPPATQLSSIHGRIAAGAHVYAVWELAREAGQTSGRANSTVTSGQPAVSETGKTGAVRVPDCQRRFLIAGEKAASRNLRCHGTSRTRRNAHIPPTDFGHAGQLITRALAATRTTLATGTPNLPAAGGCASPAVTGSG